MQVNRRNGAKPFARFFFFTIFVDLFFPEPTGQQPMVIANSTYLLLQFPQSLHPCALLSEPVEDFFTEVFGLQKERKQTLDCPNQIKIKQTNINKNLFILGFIYLFQVEYLRPRISISCSFRGEGQPFFVALFCFCFLYHLTFVIIYDCFIRQSLLSFRRKQQPFACDGARTLAQLIITLML